MNKIIKTIVAFTILALPLTSIIGCVANTPGSTTVVTTQLQADETMVSNASMVATDVYLLSIKDPIQKVKAGATAHQLALAIKATIGTNGLSLQEAQQYAVAMINKTDSADAQQAGLLLNSLVVVVQGVIDQNYSKLAANDQYVISTGLILAAANGVANATANFSAPPATTQPVTLQSLSK